jgi:hypothetical protein
MSEPEPAAGEPRVEVGNEIGRDLLTRQSSRWC